MRRVRQAVLVVLLLALAAGPGGGASGPIAPPAATWEAAAEAWEATARRLEAAGDRNGADDAWAAAAEAWERSGATAAGRVGLPRDSGASRVFELTEALRKIDAALERWRRAAVSWAASAERWSAAGREVPASDARRRAAVARTAAESLDERRAEIVRLLENEQRRMPGLPVTPEGRPGVLEGWAGTARAWEATARSWEAAGDLARAAAARGRADEARGRIRDADPSVTEAWLLARTYPEAAPPAPTAGPAGTAPPPEGAPPAAGAPPAPAGGAPALAEIPPAPDTALRRARMPPAWRLSPREREAIENAAAIRESARRWEEQARMHLAEGDATALEAARMERDRALGRAYVLEETVRRGYAEREADIASEVARLLGDRSPSADEILAALDREGAAETAPTLAAAFRSVAPPDLPPEAVPQDDTREAMGIIDIATGGPIPSTLTVNGRKVIEVNYARTDYLEDMPNRPGGNSQSNVDINQELQVRVFGRVGAPEKDHINVEVNFDDTRRGIQEVNNRTIAVAFDGARHAMGGGKVEASTTNQYEINANFGDLSSFNNPQSQFSVYNKSLFGVQSDINFYNLDWGPLGANRVTVIPIASQTKGVSASKVFRTSGTRQLLDISDVDFIRNTYFRLTLDPTTLPARNVAVYLDDRNGANDQAAVPRTAAGYEGGGAFTHAGQFDLLTAGQDYTMNLAAGIVELKRSVSDGAVLAVTYQDAVGASIPDITPKILKIGDDAPSAQRTFFRPYEMRNRYSLGREQIRRDDPDFVLEVRDLTGSAFDQGSARTYNNLFGFDEDNDGEFDREELDYDFGILVPVLATGGEDTAPFISRVPGADPALSNPILYSKDRPDAENRKYVVHVEFVSAVPQDVFVVGADIISGSDIVTVDGRRRERNRDYVIEYEGGILTFIDPGVLGPNSEIRIDYEYLPFGGRFERTIAGARVDAEVTDYFSFGTTGVFDLAADVDEAPRLALASAPDDNRVVDFTARLGVMQMLGDWWKKRTGETPHGLIWDNLRLDASGEWARSSRDPNTFGLAVVEDFEAVDDVIGAAISDRSWAPASLPDSTTNLGRPVAGGRGAFSLSMVEDYGHLAEAYLTADQTQRSLQINLDFAAGETWVALVQPLSAQAMDFSKLSSIEAYMSGADSPLQVFVDFGLVPEDADADGILDSEDRGLDGAPGTHDPGENDGLLNTGEDIGWTFDHPNRGALLFGANNGSLDGEDLDGDFLADARSEFFRVGDLNNEALADTIERQSMVGQGGATWRSYKVANPFSGNAAVAWTADAETQLVKQIRLVFARPQAAAGAAATYTLYTDGLLFRRLRFAGTNVGGRLSLLGRNDREDSLYVSLPEFNDDKKAEGIEQALAIQYSLAPGETAAIEQRFPKRVSLRDYQKLRWYVYGDGLGATFVLRLVTDAANYVEIRNPVNFGAFPLARTAAGWRMFEADLKPISDLIIQNILGAGLPVMTSGNVTIVGQPTLGQSPSLSNVNAIGLQVENNTVAPIEGEIWVNEITVRGVDRQEGDAASVAFSSGWGDLLTLAGNLSSVDPGFRGIGIINNPVSSTYNQRGSDDRGLSATIQLDRLLPSSWRLSLPLSASWRDSKSTLDPFDVESALKSDLGTISNSNQSYSTTVRWRNLPSVNLSYSDAQTDIDLRNEDRVTQSDAFNLSTGYSYTFPPRLFGIIPTGQSLSSGITYAFSRATAREDNYATAFVDRHSDNRNQNMAFSLNAVPVSPLSLRYNLGISTIDITTQDPRDRRDGMNRRAQNLGANWNVRPRWGFTPSVSTNASYDENFFLTTQGASQKDVSTSGNFGINLQVDPAAWSRYLSWLTLRYGYSITAAASYRSLPPSTALASVFNDFMAKRLFPWSQGAAVDVDPLGVSASRGSASNSSSHNWDGDVRTWPWLAWRYGASRTRSENFAVNSFSLSEGFSGRMDWRLDYNAAFPNAWLKFDASTILWGFNFTQSEAVTTKSDNFTPNFSWSMRWHDRLLTTLGMNYNRSRNRTLAGVPRFTRNESYSPNFSFDYAFDIGMPEGISLPGEGRILSFERRVRMNGSLGATFNRASDQGVLTADNLAYNAGLGLSYRLQRNLDLSAGATYSYIQDDLASLNDRMTVGANSRLVWQF